MASASICFPFKSRSIRFSILSHLRLRSLSPKGVINFSFCFKGQRKFHPMSIGRYGVRGERTGSGKQHSFLFYPTRRHDDAAGHWCMAGCVSIRHHRAIHIQRSSGIITPATKKVAIRKARFTEHQRVTVLKSVKSAMQQLNAPAGPRFFAGRHRDCQRMTRCENFPRPSLVS